MKQHIRTIKSHVSGDVVFSRVAAIAKHHRIQASTGFRRAARYCQGELSSAGFHSSIRSYPSDGESWYLTCRSFEEWHCREAYCDMVYPQSIRLADFSEDNMTIIQRSNMWPHRDKVLDVVMLDKGSDESAYDGQNLDLRGKIVFVRDHFQKYMEWAVVEHGAVGIITDYIPEETSVRTRQELYDIVNYTSFWWRDGCDHPEAFGFVLSPQAGDQLAEVCRITASQHAADRSLPMYPQFECYVDADLYPGEIEVVEAVLPGDTEEEILVVSHLCHPRASANDNATGVAASIEVFRVLRDLTLSGKLPPLRRSIRMFLIPEFTGTYAFLADIGATRKRLMAGINLDMVGGRQDGSHGPITISGVPHALPSFVTDVGSMVLDEIRKEVISHNRDNYVAMFNSCVTEFQAGSDNYILSDPTVGIPCIMLGQWPDKYYHTSGDSLEQVDSEILQRSVSIAASYVFLMANLGVSDVPQILNKGRESFSSQLSRLLDMAYDKGLSAQNLYERICHSTVFQEGACDDYLRFFSGADAVEVCEMVCREKERLQLISATAFSSFLESMSIHSFEPEAKSGNLEYDYVPVREYVSPIMNIEAYIAHDADLMARFRAYEKLHRPKVTSPHLTEALIQFYVDGKRTVNQIIHELLMEGREDVPEMVHDYIQLLVGCGAIKLV